MAAFLNSSPRRLCSSQAEDKGNSCKTLAQTKKEQHWCYDPTIKYESLRQSAVPRYVYYDDSDSPASTSSDSEIETETETEAITEEKVQTRKDIILAEARKEQPFAYKPYLNYELLKQFAYFDSPDFFASPPSDSENDTPEEVEAKMDKYIDAVIHRQLYFYEPDSNTNLHQFYKDAKFQSWSDSSASKSETETQSQTYEDKIFAGTEGEERFCYDHRIKYEPLKRYIVPRFAFFDSSSTDWSDSESDTELLAEKEAQSQKDKIPAGFEE